MLEGLWHQWPRRIESHASRHLRLAKMQMPLTERRETAELLEVAPAGSAQQGRGARRFSFRHNEAGPGLLFGAI